MLEILDELTNINTFTCCSEGLVFICAAFHCPGLHWITYFCTVMKISVCFDIAFQLPHLDP